MGYSKVKSKSLHLLDFACPHIDLMHFKLPEKLITNQYFNKAVILITNCQTDITNAYIGTNRSHHSSHSI